MLVADSDIQKNIILAMSKDQQEIMQESDAISIDNNYKSSPKWAHRTLSIRSHYRGKIKYKNFCLCNRTYIIIKAVG